MRSKATRGMFTTDGAGREELTAATEDAVNERLEARGITRDNTDADTYDREFDLELHKLMEEAEDDYADYEVDRYEADMEDREYFDNLPGGRADYMYG